MPVTRLLDVFYAIASVMHRTIFSTPLINTLLRVFSVTYLKLAGWQVKGALPAQAQKSVLIAAPHTSNWDLPYTLMVAFALRLNIYWMGKASIFRFPFGPVMRWLGGIAVDRVKNQQPGDRLRASHPGCRWCTATDRATRGHAQQNALLENRLLSHRGDGAGADRDGLHGLPSARSAAWGPCLCRPATWKPTWRRSRRFTPPSRARIRASSRQNNRQPYCRAARSISARSSA